MADAKARLLAILKTAAADSVAVAGEFNVGLEDHAKSVAEQAEIEWAIEALTSGEIRLEDAP